MPSWLQHLIGLWPIGIPVALMLVPLRSRLWMGVVIVVPLLLMPLLMAFHWTNPYVIHLAALICITAILSVSLNLINGVTGLFSLGHAGFAIVGGYVAGTLTTFVFQLGAGGGFFADTLIFILCLLLGGIAAALFGFLVGLPTLRLRGDYLAIATLGFGEIMRVILQTINFKHEVAGRIFELGGPRGISGIPDMPGLAIAGTARYMPAVSSFVFSFLALVLIVWAIRNLVFSSHGRACAAIREDEVAAEILGVDTVFYKVGTFTIGAFFAGVGGGLLAHWSNMVHPSMGGFLISIQYLVIIYVGGIGSLSGSILAAVLLTVFSEVLKDVLSGQDAWRMVGYGAILIAMMLWRPQGLYGNREFRWLLPRRRTG